MNKHTMFLVLGLLGMITCHAARVSSTIYATDKSNAPIGDVVFSDTPYGLLITPHLTSLPPGLHGFHLHQHADCNDHGIAAGGHFDPNLTNTHQGPYGNGHLGDLPVLYVDANGQALTTTLAPRLKSAFLKTMAVMVHAGGDNYTDNPPLGGGGARIACGVIKVNTTG